MVKNKINCWIITFGMLIYLLPYCSTTNISFISLYNFVLNALSNVSQESTPNLPTTVSKLSF